jgi:hypothetical protein
VNFCDLSLKRGENILRHLFNNEENNSLKFLPQPTNGFGVKVLRVEFTNFLGRNRRMEDV